MPVKLLRLSLIFIVYALLKWWNAHPPFARQPLLFVEFLDIGQGDATLVTTAGKKRMLIDAGPDYYVDKLLADEMPFVPCELDAIVLTHPQKDHMNGFNKLLQRCRVKRVYFNAVAYSSAEYSAFLDNIKDLPVYPLKTGDMFTVDGVKFYVLWPQSLKYRTNVNNSSLVLLLDYGDFEVLLPGDAEKEIFSQIDFVGASRFIEGGLDIYKVSHHGSYGAVHEPALRYLKPKISVASAGRNNSYGHPHEATVRFLESIGSKVYRTDRDGTVRFEVTP